MDSESSSSSSSSSARPATRADVVAQQNQTMTALGELTTTLQTAERVVTAVGASSNPDEALEYSGINDRQEISDIEQLGQQFAIAVAELQRQKEELAFTRSNANTVALQAEADKMARELAEKELQLTAYFTEILQRINDKVKRGTLHFPKAIALGKKLNDAVTEETTKKESFMEMAERINNVYILPALESIKETVAAEIPSAKGAALTSLAATSATSATFGLVQVLAPAKVAAGASALATAAIDGAIPMALQSAGVCSLATSTIGLATGIPGTVISLCVLTGLFANEGTRNSITSTAGRAITLPVRVFGRLRDAVYDAVYAMDQKTFELGYRSFGEGNDYSSNNINTGVNQIKNSPVVLDSLEKVKEEWNKLSETDRQKIIDAALNDSNHPCNDFFTKLASKKPDVDLKALETLNGIISTASSRAPSNPGSAVAAQTGVKRGLKGIYNANTDEGEENLVGQLQAIASDQKRAAIALSGEDEDAIIKKVIAGIAVVIPTGSTPEEIAKDALGRVGWENIDEAIYFINNGGNSSNSNSNSNSNIDANSGGRRKSKQRKSKQRKSKQRKTKRQVKRRSQTKKGKKRTQTKKVVRRMSSQKQMKQQNQNMSKQQMQKLMMQQQMMKYNQQNVQQY